MQHVASPLPTVEPPFIPATARPRGRMPPPARNQLSAAIGGRLTALRVAAGMSGRELASRAHISRSLLSRVERGLVTPSIGTLAKMAWALELPIAALFRDDVTCCVMVLGSP